MSERSTKAAKPKQRCAVYTRKSSEEGLEQAFNSLDAQREACEAYVASQRHEGWSLVPDRYDDGGVSGGTMERPALKALMSNIAAGRIDVVVVYKVDRLTRALGDFARLVELFDRHKVSFVSVTQAFNTTTSMGRLTLNVLLSFAQFEREVTGERIRDKIAASKKKGMWMGGQPALGYDVRSRKLVVNDAEAATVRHIYRRYLELRSVRNLKAELDEAGVVSKARIAADGSPYGAQRFYAGAIYAMLRNRVYRGEIVHKGTPYPGEHDAIVDETLFAQVQSVLATNRVERGVGNNCVSGLLTGLMFDAAGERLTPTYAIKRHVRYRYYVSRHLITGAEGDGRGMRLPAPNLEMFVRTRVGVLLTDPAELTMVTSSSEDQAEIVAAGMRRAGEWKELATDDLKHALNVFVSRITVGTDRIEIAIRPGPFVAWLTGTPETRNRDDVDAVISAPVRLQQRGQEMRMAFGNEHGTPAGHPALVRLLVRAHAARRRVFDERMSVEEAAKAEGVIPSYVTRLIRLTFLAPDIMSTILSGRQDPDLTATRLMADTRFPLDWTEQRKAFASA